MSEWRSVLVARETAWLSREHRAVVDAELAPKLGTMGDRRVEAEAKRLAYRLAPEGAVARVRRAESDRRLTLRPTPETMANLSATVPVAQGVAAHVALSKEADRLIAAGDARSRGQIMADTLIERVTGQASATDVPVEINLVMNSASLLDAASPDADEPAYLEGYGPLPAAFARRLALQLGVRTPAWLRRLFVAPDTGELSALETRRRCFTPAQRRFLRLRDQHCRTPWCEAPIRHADHIRPAERGGPTSTANAQGDCAACNYTKQIPGWRTDCVAAPAHEVEITTPTGHRYRSRPPTLPRAA